MNKKSLGNNILTVQSVIVMVQRWLRVDLISWYMTCQVAIFMKTEYLKELLENGIVYISIIRC
jgi:hypothetical protein